MSRLFLKGLFVLLCLLLSSTVDAQKLIQFVSAGDKELEAGFPQSALEYYQLALTIDTHFIDANMGAAEAYRKLRNYKRSAAHYKEVVENDGEDDFLEANMYQGMMLMQLGKYTQAKPCIQYFLSAYRQRNETYKFARTLLQNCEWAIEHENDTAQYEVSIPDSGLNSIHAEMSPFRFDSNILYFSTMRYEKDIVKKSKSIFIEQRRAILDSNTWVETKIDLPIADSKAHVGNGTFNQDRNVFYYSKCGALKDCKIFYITKLGDSWSEPKEMPSPVNENGNSSTQPTVAAFDDLEYLYFASNREGGKGGMDLWFVELRDNNPLKLRNLGTRLNTAGDEITPWFDVEDTTLYYSSNLSDGFGGFDIYKSRGLPGRFNKVENLGPEVNSPADDYYFNFVAKDSSGYFSSNRKGGLKAGKNETCCNDLYQVKRLPEPEPIIEDTVVTDTVAAIVTTITPGDSGMVAIVDEDSTLPIISVPVTMRALKEVLPIKMFYHNDSPNPRTTSRTTKLTYAQAFDEYLNRKNEYLTAIDSADLSQSERAEYKENIIEFFDKELRTSINHQNAALDILFEELQSGKNIELVIKGYASPLANSNYNLNLTYRRIDAIINYFEQYDSAKLAPFIINEQLLLNALPYGESQAANTVSDLVDDKLGSIYGSKAAFERRIEIQSIEQVD